MKNLLLTHLQPWTDPDVVCQEARETSFGPHCRCQPRWFLSCRQTLLDGCMTTRKDLRSLDELRNVTITPRWQEAGEGSCLVEFGKTRVLCTASFTEGVPRWKQGSGEGWVTAEVRHAPQGDRFPQSPRSV